MALRPAGVRGTLAHAFANGAAASTWALSGTPTYNDGTRTLTINGFATLQAGSGGDTFTVTAPSTFNLKGGIGNIEKAAQTLGLTLTVVQVATREEIAPGLAALTSARVEAVQWLARETG